MLYTSTFNTSGQKPLTSYSEPNGVLRLWDMRIPNLRHQQTQDLCYWQIHLNNFSFRSIRLLTLVTIPSQSQNQCVVTTRWVTLPFLPSLLSDLRKNINRT